MISVTIKDLPRNQRTITAAYAMTCTAVTAIGTEQSPVLDSVSYTIR
jgi:hypothetical protein